MERTDWLDGGLDSAAARFLMMTAITHHEFSSPTWGEHEVRKLHAELAELDRLAAQAVVDHAGSGPQRRRVNVRLTTLTKPRESAVKVPGLAPRSVRTKRAFDLPNGPSCCGRANVHARLGEPASRGPAGRLQGFGLVLHRERAVAGVEEVPCEVEVSSGDPAPSPAGGAAVMQMGVQRVPPDAAADGEAGEARNGAATCS